MEILLRKDEMLALDGGRCGRLVRCGEGILWITQEGDWRDYLLRRGENFQSALPGRIVITAMADCRLNLPHSVLAGNARSGHSFRLKFAG